VEQEDAGKTAHRPPSKAETTLLIEALSCWIESSVTEKPFINRIFSELFRFWMDESAMLIEELNCTVLSTKTAFRDATSDFSL
jgi:hypothetical protein